VYPTVQFLYSHYIGDDYITSEVQKLVKSFDNEPAFYARFDEAIAQKCAKVESPQGAMAEGIDITSCQGSTAVIREELTMQVEFNEVRQNPAYTLAAISEGVYIIGMKDQFNASDLNQHYLHDRVQYVADDMGFILYEKPGPVAKSVDQFGPYFIEQYILMEVLSKQEVAQNVLNYYSHHKPELERGLANYDETQGKGFVCWRFINDIANRTKHGAAAEASSGNQVGEEQMRLLTLDE
jgi:hypothetical protein